MIPDLHITVGINAKGKPVVLYAGADVVKAGKAFETAGEEFQIVGIINHPQPTRTRFPVQEAAQMDEQARRANGEAERVKAAALAKAAGNRAQAEQLLAEAEALHPTPEPSPKTAKELRAEAAALLAVAEQLDPKKTEPQT